MTIELIEKNIDIISRLQKFTLRCIKMFGPEIESRLDKAKKKELMENWSKFLFKDREYVIIFDETIWPAENPNNYANVVKVLVRTGMSGKYIEHIVNFNDHTSDIFNVRYIPIK